MQLFVWTQELHTLEVTSRETSIAPEDQVMLLAGMTLMDGATLDTIVTVELLFHLSFVQNF
ncbi:unnamed protein product [Nyctereutes procyonoides]|uniref:(raccoon dog) hypothetical protein n=1 Tax=Nyctereutes procyonoides TaxID=34880 RepID=A0A811ZQ38_NYCPR|nr:unnamed protein product [Nyctereutes procyonoides]